MKYIRIQATYNSTITGKPLGVFGVIHGLQSRNELTDLEVEVFNQVKHWFEENLAQPQFYKKGNSPKGISWFKESSKEMLMKIEPLINIMKNHNVCYEIKETLDPSEIIYEDDFQVCSV